MLKIEKFKAGKRVQTILMPEFFLRIAGLLIPNTVKTELSARGLSIADIVEAKRARRPYRTTLTVREHGAEKQIVISRG